MFYKTALLGKRVQEYLKKIVELSAAERSDILFYLLYGVVASALGKNKINFPDIKKIEIEEVTDILIGAAMNPIYKRYKELGGNGRVAKSSSFVEEIDKLLPFSKETSDAEQ